jgi:ATP-dependent DNA helicase PIF1
VPPAQTHMRPSPVFSGFVDILNEMRLGKVSPTAVAELQALQRPVSYPDGIVPTQLCVALLSIQPVSSPLTRYRRRYPRRQQVDAANAVRMAALPSTDLRTYYAQDGGKLPAEQRRRVLEGFMAPPTLLLKVDAQVMLIKKIDDELVNGTVGRVIRFTDAARWNREPAGPTSASAAPLPSGPSSRLEWPLVDFQTAKGKSVHALVGPESFKAEFPDGKVAASRIQVEWPCYQSRSTRSPSPRFISCH